MLNRIPFRLLLPIAAVALSLSDTARACWVDIPLDVLVRTEPLIITGRIGESKPLKGAGAGARPMATAGITVDTVLKNALLPGLKLETGDVIPLLMPGSGGPRVSTDITFKPGTEGVWLLERTKDGKHFAATCPKDYQPLAKRKEIEEALRKVEKSVMVEIDCLIPRPSRNFKGAAVIATLYEKDPNLAGAASCKQVDQKILPGVEIVNGRDFRAALTLAADRNEGREYFVTVLLHPDEKGGKRLYYADGINQVCEEGKNYQKLDLKMRPGRR